MALCSRAESYRDQKSLDTKKVVAAQNSGSVVSFCTYLPYAATEKRMSTV